MKIFIPYLTKSTISTEVSCINNMNTSFSNQPNQNECNMYSSNLYSPRKPEKLHSLFLFQSFWKYFPANHLSPATLREGIVTRRRNNAIYLFSTRFASFYSIMLSYYTLIKWKNLKMYTASNLWQDCWQFTFMERLFLHKIVILDSFYRTEWLCNKKVAFIVHT